MQRFVCRPLWMELCQKTVIPQVREQLSIDFVHTHIFLDSQNSPVDQSLNNACRITLALS